MYERSVSVVSEQEEAEGCAHKHSNNFQGETNKTINTFRYTSPTITQDETGQWLLRKYTLWLMLVKIEGWWSESQPISFILKYLQTGSIPSTVYWAAGMCAHRLAPLWAPQPNCQQASAQPSQHRVDKADVQTRPTTSAHHEWIIQKKNNSHQSYFKKQTPIHLYRDVRDEQ